MPSIQSQQLLLLSFAKKHRACFCFVFGLYFCFLVSVFGVHVCVWVCGGVFERSNSNAVDQKAEISHQRQVSWGRRALALQPLHVRLGSGVRPAWTPQMQTHV